jgi:lipopolysaccharide export system permease protein
MLVILDRYIGRVFVSYFLICLLGGVGLFTVISVGARLDDFLGGGFGNIIVSILKYALWNVPVVICYIFPPMLLISAGWALVQLAKNNELIAIKASGVSVYRIIIPLFVGGAITGVIVASMQEWLIPVLAPGIAEANYPGEKEIRRKLAGPVPNTDVAYRIESYNIITNEMTNPFFWCVSGTKTIEASRGEWKKGKWVLYDVIINMRDPETRTNAREECEKKEFLFKDLPLLPADITTRQADPGLLSSRQLMKLIARHPDDPKLRVNLHSRISYPFTGIVLLLIGLPFVVGFERINRSKILGLGMCFVICAGFYAVTFLCNTLGNNNYLPAPWMAAWIPVILFSAVGIFFFDMIRT